MFHFSVWNLTQVTLVRKLNNCKWNFFEEKIYSGDRNEISLFDAWGWAGHRSFAPLRMTNWEGGRGGERRWMLDNECRE